MGKQLEIISGNGAILIDEIPENIHVKDIIKDKSIFHRDRLIIKKDDNRLKTVSWYGDSLPSRVAEETYDVFETSKGKTLLGYIKYHRPGFNTKHHNKLVRKLEKAGIEGR